jgi:TRAP-type C4-dicarboxylate transport system permease small subunit
MGSEALQSRPVPPWLIALEGASSVISTAMAYLSGAAFLLLSFYITYDVLGRRYGFTYSGVTDEMSGYVLAVAGTGGLAYALRIGAHVRIDLLIPMMPRKARAILNLGNIALIGLFAGQLAYYSWLSAIESFEIGARGISLLQAPLAIPQSLMAAGLTALALQAVVILAADISRFILFGGDVVAGPDPGSPTEAETEGIRGV